MGDVGSGRGRQPAPVARRAVAPRAAERRAGGAGRPIGRAWPCRALWPFSLGGPRAFPGPCPQANRGTPPDPTPAEAGENSTTTRYLWDRSPLARACSDGAWPSPRAARGPVRACRSKPAGPCLAVHACRFAPAGPCLPAHACRSMPAGPCLPVHACRSMPAGSRLPVHACRSLAGHAGHAQGTDSGGNRVVVGGGGNRARFSRQLIHVGPLVTGLWRPKCTLARRSSGQSLAGRAMSCVSLGKKRARGAAIINTPPQQNLWTRRAGCGGRAAGRTGEPVAGAARGPGGDGVVEG